MPWSCQWWCLSDAVLGKVNLLTGSESHNGLFPMGGAAIISASFALLLACHLKGVDQGDLLLEESLYSMFDLDLIRVCGDTKYILVKFFGEKAGLLRHKDAANDVVGFFHREAELALKAVAKGLESILGDDDFVESEKILGIDLRGRNEQISLDIAGCKEGRAGEAGRDDQRAADSTMQALHQGDELLGLGIFKLKGLNDENITGKNAGAKGLAEGKALDGFGSILGVAARVWAVRDTATNPDRGAGVAGTGAASTFLLPGLFTGKIHGCLGFDASCSAAAVGTHGNDDIVNRLGSLSVSNDFDLGLFGRVGCENSSAHGLLGFLCGFLDGGANDNKGPLGARDCSADKDHSIGFAHLDDLKILDRDALISHVTWHAHVFPNTAWGQAVTDSTVTAMHHRTVSLGLTGKFESANNALETFTLGGADDVNKLSILEVCDRPCAKLWSCLAILKKEFAKETLGSRTALGKVTKLGLADTMLFLVTKADLDGVIAFLILALNLKNAIAACLNDSNGADATLRVIDTGHADFFAENADAHNA